MERERGRMQEAEVEITLPPETMLGMFERQTQDKERLVTLPRVRRYNEVPWVVGGAHTPYMKMYLGVPDWGGRLEVAPIYSMHGSLQKLPPGASTGRHRHHHEAIFYILEGNGYEIHDGVRRDWEAGKVACVPAETVHQHFNASFSEPCTFYFSIPRVYTFHGISTHEQLTWRPDFEPEGESSKVMMGALGEDKYLREVMKNRAAQRQWQGEVKDTYDEYVKLLVDENNFRETAPRVLDPADLPWENTRQGKIKWVAHPKVPTVLYTIDAFLQEIPPGGHSGKHRHTAEEVHLIIDGKGYDIHDGARYDWEKYDLVCIPVHATHQHFNTDPNNPALFFSVTPRVYTFMGQGGIEHFEDASDYKP